MANGDVRRARPPTDLVAAVGDGAHPTPWRTTPCRSTGLIYGGAIAPRRQRSLIPWPVINCRTRQSAQPGHQADPAASQRRRFQGDKAPTALFIQNGCHLPIALPCGARLRGSNHPATLRRVISTVNPGQKFLLSCDNFDSVVYGWGLRLGELRGSAGIAPGQRASRRALVQIKCSATSGVGFR
jgi:hypothetical protein